MNDQPSKPIHSELPIRSKYLIINILNEILEAFPNKDSTKIRLLTEELKSHALLLDETIQQKILGAIAQILLETDGTSDFDPTQELQSSIEQLIESMGFFRL